MIIFLVGFMGSGKNYWAEKLSAEMDIPWTDLDEVISSAESSSIADIFSEKGESYFRQKEAEILRSVTLKYQNRLWSGSDQQSSITAIIATGGGAPCFHHNMDWMNEHGFTVWLNPPVSELAERLKNETEVRPLLKNLNAVELVSFITEKLIQREEFYRQAKLEIKNTNIAVKDFINLILHA